MLKEDRGRKARRQAWGLLFDFTVVLGSHMKLETQPLVLSQVTQSLSLEGSGLVYSFFLAHSFIGPEEEITGREGAPGLFVPCSVVW